MTDEITQEIFTHLVDLAALDLDPNEAEYLRNQFNNQLRAIHELETIPVSSTVQVTSHGVLFTPENSPVLREDIWKPYEDTQAILKQAPDRDEGYLVVPDIPHTDLE